MHRIPRWVRCGGRSLITGPACASAELRMYFLINVDSRVESKALLLRLMAGIMGADGGTSLLETPPYVIAIVFLFFLVVTLGFEWVIFTKLHLETHTDI